MLTGKQKRYLRALGSIQDPIVQIGKAGVVQALIESANDALKARELIKIRVLRNCPYEPEDAIKALAKETSSELVQVIGRNGLLFKRNEEKMKITLPE